jgi:hypothetical protein
MSTGRGVRIAVIDSGIHAAHPHVQGVAGGVAFDGSGRAHFDHVDRLGHGTAVAAAIREKAPDAELFAVKVFDRSLSTRIDNLVSAIEWAADAGMHIANLSLGTPRIEHEAVLRVAVDHAVSRHVLIVAAHDDDGVQYLPGRLSGVLAVRVDWSCPRDEYRAAVIEGRTLFRAAGLPREIPGVPPSRNLRGISFAVANMTGFAARALEHTRDRSVETATRLLLRCRPQGREAPRRLDLDGVSS